MKFNKTTKMFKEQKEEYTKHLTKLYIYILQYISAICVTTFQTSTASVLNAIVDTTNLIILNKAC